MRDALYLTMKNIQLYDYQQDMLERIKAAFCSHRSVMVQMPTGTGKTHVLAAVVETFVVGLQKKVWIVAHRHELIEQIEAILEKYDIGEKTALVEVMSIQWLSRHYREMEDEPGLIVIDEAHHAPAGSYAEIMRAFPKTKKLGVTATPCRLNGRGFTDLFELMLESWSVNRFIAEERLCDAVLQHASGKKGIVYAIDIQHADHITEYYRGMAGTVINSIIVSSGVDVHMKHHGPHSLRHSLASALLKEDSSLPVISEVLGHKRTDTTMVYLRIDIQSLLKCANPVPVVADGFYTQRGGAFYE